jgi:hypothetical protein
MKSSLPADLLELKARFDAWRKTRQTRAPIPDDLRPAAVALLARYSASMICRVCRLHPHSLKKAAAFKPSAASVTALPAPAFLALPAPAMQQQVASTRQTANECRLQVERPDGARLTLTLPAPDRTTLAHLCADFLRA